MGNTMYAPAMNQIVLVALGGAIGASARYVGNNAVLRLLGAGFPYGTMLVNITGSLAMGLLMGWLATRDGSDNLRLFLGTGILGGFTTFSAFSWDAVLLYQRGETVAALVYVLASIIISILALAAGLAVMRLFFSPA
jgi:fluoride exporter